MNWTAPIAGPVCETNEGVLRISVPQRKGGYNQWIESIADAPMLKMDAPAGDWDLTCRLDLNEFASDSAFHVGMIAGFDDAMVCAFGWFHGAGVGVPGAPELWVEATGMAHLAAAKVDCSSVYLKMSKRGNTFECYYRKAETDERTLVGNYLGAFPPRFVGLMGKTIGDGPGVTFSVQLQARHCPRPCRYVDAGGNQGRPLSDRQQNLTATSTATS